MLPTASVKNSAPTTGHFTCAPPPQARPAGGCTPDSIVGYLLIVLSLAPIGSCGPAYFNLRILIGSGTTKGIYARTFGCACIADSALVRVVL